MKYPDVPIIRKPKALVFVTNNFFVILLKVWLFFALLLLQHLQPLCAQSYFEFDQEKADSITGVLPDLKGREKIDALNELAELSVRHYPEKSIPLAEEALRLSIEKSYSYGKARANYILGTVYHNQGSFISSTKYLMTAYKILKKKGPSEELAICTFLISYNLYVPGTDYSAGIDYLSESNRIFKESGAKYLAGLSMMNFSAVMRWEKKYHEALRMNAEAISVLVTNNLGRSIDKAIATAIRGDIVRDTGNLRGAINYYLQSLSYYDTTRIEDIALKAQVLGTLGMDYMNFGKTDSAIYYLNQSLKDSRSVRNIFSMPFQFTRLAQYALSVGDTNLAVVNYDSALYYLDIADSLGYYYLDKKHRYYISYSFELYYPTPIKVRRVNIYNNKLIIYRALSSIYRDQGDYKKILKIHEKADALKDSVFLFKQTALSNEMKDILVRYETEEKDRQIELLSKENELRNFQVRQERYFLIGTIGMTLMVIVIALFFIRLNRLKSQHQNESIKQKLLRLQMNPHFIFNSLASIQNTIINNDPEKATRYLARFSKLVRNILDSSVEDFIPLEEEISTIENYLKLQRFRFPDKFDFNIETDPELDTESIIIPAMLVQPFVENSIEHGMKQKIEKGNIRVRFKKKDSELVIEVEDDGIGRNKAKELLKEQEKDHKSLANDIVRDRIKILNKIRKRKIIFEVSDLNDANGNPCGTLVRITIPV